MERSILIKIFFASWILTSAAIFWPLRDTQALVEEAVRGANRAKTVLHEEARLIEFFCLSKVPRLYDRTLIPQAWSEALNSEIAIRETIGEVAGFADPLKEQAEAIRNLAAGLSIFGSDEKQFYLVYHPKDQPGFIVVSKEKSELRADKLPKRPSPVAIAIAGGLLVSLLMTGIVRFLTRAPATMRS